MSADNACYIRPLKNGTFAVKVISSLYHEYMTDEEIDKCFENAEICQTLEEADKKEEEIQDKWEANDWFIEYGAETIKRNN